MIVKRTSRKPKRTSRRAPARRTSRPRRNGFFGDLFKRENWGYAFYDRAGKLMFSGVPNQRTRQEAESVAYFGWEHVPGVRVAVAADIDRWKPLPKVWTHEWKMAAYEGIDRMKTWDHQMALGEARTERVPTQRAVSKTLQMPAMQRNASRAAVDGTPEAAAILSTGRRVFVVRGLATHGTQRAMRKQALPTLVVRSPSEAAAAAFARRAYNKSLQRGTEVDLRVEAV